MRGIDGANMVWYCQLGSSLYDGGTIGVFDFPGAERTSAWGIDDYSIVGYYDGPAVGLDYHGFIYTIPEPGTVLLLGVGGIGLVRRRRGWCA